MKLETLILLLICLAAGGCVEERVVRPSFASLRQYADPKPDPAAASRTTASANARIDAGEGDWSIEVASLEGADRYARAQKAYNQLSGHDLPPLWLQDAGDRAVIYCGRFADPSVPEAQFALGAITSIEHDGQRPFKSAAFKPLSGQVNLQMDPYDLRQYAGFTTLEVAVFTPRHATDRKDAAEQLAHQMRAQGHDAYFYHGVNSSSVCIGLFTRSDYVREGNIEVPGPRMREVQGQYPDYHIDGRDAKALVPPASEGEPALPTPTQSYFVRVL